MQQNSRECNLLIVGIVGLMAPSLVSAQTVVRGELRDSLTNQTFASATIQLVPTAAPWSAGLTVVSDSAGRYQIRGVGKGSYTFGFQHPRLDSLGFDAVARPLEVSGADETIIANLALPSAATLRRNLCGVTSNADGVIIGRITDAESGVAASTMLVLVEWIELQFGQKSFERILQSATGAVTPDGRYVVCGVPLDSPVQLRAVPLSNESKLGSGAISLQLNAATPLLHRDLLVAPRGLDTTSALVDGDSSGDMPTRRLRGRARLIGVVRSAGNVPIAGARVSVPDAGTSTTTASDGSFRLGALPAGTVAVEITAVGFALLHSSADLRGEREASVQPVLSRPIATLDSVRVFSARQTDRVGFSTRRKKGLGYFVTAEQARMNGALDVPAALATAPALRSGTRGRGGCRPMVYLDGLLFDGDVGGLGSRLDSAAPFADIGGLEVYANPADAPAQFSSPGARMDQKANEGGCAVVVIWTKGFVP